MWTPDERRGAATLLVLLLAGAAWDLHRALQSRPEPPETVVARVAAAPPAAADSTPRTANLPAAANGRLDLNRASPAELEALPGIGPVLARRIDEHRQRQGPFRSVDELRAVRGVGPRLLERVRPRVVVPATR